MKEKNADDEGKFIHVFFYFFWRFKSRVPGHPGTVVLYYTTGFSSLNRANTPLQDHAPLKSKKKKALCLQTAQIIKLSIWLIPYTSLETPSLIMG